MNNISKTFTIAEYLRVSAEDRDIKQAGKEESDSIVNQRTLLSDFISRMPEAEGAEIIEFCDDGFSGKNFERPALQRMLKQIREGKIQCIIVKDMSRFGRDYLSVGNYLSKVFPFLGVRFIAVNDGFDSINPSDIDSLETSFKTLIYDYYSRDISGKVRNAKRFKARKGDFLSPFAPYGYKKDSVNKNHLVVDAEAAEVVRRIFQMTIEGRRPVQTAHELNSMGVLTPMMYKRAAGCSRTVWQSTRKDNFWTGDMIVAILRDEYYIGRTIYGKHIRDEVGKPHVVRVKRPDWIIVDDTHEKIVSVEDFELAQTKLREYKERNLGSPGKKGNLFYKKVRCGLCGHIMVRENTKEPYYICRNYRLTDAYLCTGERIPEKDLREIVLSGIRKRAAFVVEMGAIWDEKKKQKVCDMKKTAKDIAGLKGDLSKLELQGQELYEEFVLGELGKTEYLALKNNLSKKQSATIDRIEVLEKRLTDEKKNGETGNRLIEKFRQYEEFEKLTTEIVSDVLQEIVVYPDKRINVVWNYQEDLEGLIRDRECDKPE